MPAPRPLTDAYKAAKARWPDAELELDDFVAHALSKVGDDEAKLAQAHLDDVFFAVACARHERWAIDELDRSLIPKALTASRSVDKAGQLQDEVRQQLFTQLLLEEGDRPPKLLEYSGTGPLENWIRTVAMRMTLALLPSRPQQESLEAAASVDAGDPELDYLKEQYREELKTAFQEAVRRLSDEDANLLRLHLIDHLSIDRLAQLFGIHRATAARRLTAVRQRLCDETRRALAHQVGLRGTGLDSMLRLVRSQVDLSVARLLKRQEE